MIRKSLNGEFFVIDGDRWITAWAESAGRLDHDQNALPIILKHIPKGGVALDAGANIGSHCVAYLDAVGPDGCVIAFEPHPISYRVLLLNCHGTRAFSSFQLGLAENYGRLNLALNRENPGASFIGDGEGLPIYVAPLDALNLNRLDFAKFDLEGFELLALRGAVETINRCRPTMVVEVNKSALARQGTSPAHLLGFISTLGYSYQNIYPRQDCVGEQFDVLCKPL